MNKMIKNFKIIIPMIKLIDPVFLLKIFTEVVMIYRVFTKKNAEFLFIFSVTLLFEKKSHYCRQIKYLKR